MKLVANLACRITSAISIFPGIAGFLAGALWIAANGDAFASPPAQPYSLGDFVTCKDAKTEAPHDWHIPGAVFNTCDSNVFAWVELTNVSGKHVVMMRMYRPDGSYYGKETQTTGEEDGYEDWFRMAAWWHIKGYDMAQTPGRWKVELVIDDLVQRSLFFQIRSEVLAPTAARGAIRLNPAPEGLASATWVLEASADLTHWTPVQTNSLPPLPKGSPLSFRLRLSAPDIATCTLEASADLLNWVPVQTNSLQLDPGSPRVPALFYRAHLAR